MKNVRISMNKDRIYQKKCANCGELFTTQSSRQKYCCSKCCVAVTNADRVFIKGRYIKKKNRELFESVTR